MPSDWALLQQTVTVSCKPCTAGWTRQETSGGLRTCVRCDKKQYVMDPNEHRCQACPAGATCEAGSFAPTNPADSVWNSTSNGIYRITSCPAGYVLIREDAEPTSDRCVACPPDTYSVEEAVFGERLWDRSVENYNQYCHPCPRSRAMCSGENDVRPIAGTSYIFISPSRYICSLSVSLSLSLFLSFFLSLSISLSLFLFLSLSLSFFLSLSLSFSLSLCLSSKHFRFYLHTRASALSIPPRLAPV